MESLAGLDLGTYYFFRAHTPQMPLLRGVMSVCEWLGTWFVLAPAAVLILYYLASRKNQRAEASFAGAIVLGLAAVEILKRTVARLRPDEVDNAGFSFPCGQAAYATLIYGVAAFVLADLIGRSRWRFAIYAAAVLIVYLVGFSQILLSRYYMTDVWAGWNLGLQLLVICSWFGPVSGPQLPKS